MHKGECWGAVARTEAQWCHPLKIFEISGIAEVAN